MRVKSFWQQRHLVSPGGRTLSLTLNTFFLNHDLQKKQWTNFAEIRVNFADFINMGCKKIIILKEVLEFYLAHSTCRYLSDNLSVICAHFTNIKAASCLSGRVNVLIAFLFSFWNDLPGINRWVERWVESPDCGEAERIPSLTWGNSTSKSPCRAQTDADWARMKLFNLLNSLQSGTSCVFSLHLASRCLWCLVKS